MKYAVDSKSMKKIDDYTVENIKIPALVLMERAALKTAEAMLSYINKNDHIIVVCGPGNNGGDGIATGRILSLWGYQVAILFPFDEVKATSQTKAQLEIARNLGLRFEHCNKLSEYNIIIDAIFGVGLSREVTGDYEALIQLINQRHSQGRARVIAIDIPSGVSADHGRIMNIAVRADFTITFGFMKLGLLLYPGAEYAGEVTVADIGFPEIALQQVDLTHFYYEREDLEQLPLRPMYSHKGSFGKVLVIAGSKGMSGAAYLSAKAAYRMGAGLVKVLTDQENRIVLQTSLPEALYEEYNWEGLTKEEWELKLKQVIKWATVVVIGPGLGKSQLSADLLELVRKEASVPLIIDADGLNLLSDQMDRLGLDSQSRWTYLNENLRENTILTPHLMELSRLLGIDLAELRNNLIDTAGQYSYNSKLILIMKDARTIVANHGKAYINISGNQGMATGGSGDVLTGIIAGLIAQGMAQQEAACLGVYIHGLSGDEAADRHGSYSIMAHDLIDSLENVIKGSNQNSFD